MKVVFNSRVSVPALVCYLHLPISSYYFRIRTPRTLMFQSRSRDTKMVRTRSISLLEYLFHRTSNLEAPGSIGSLASFPLAAGYHGLPAV